MLCSALIREESFCGEWQQVQIHSCWRSWDKVTTGALSPKEDLLLPTRLREHCERRDRKSASGGKQREELRSAVFLSRCSHWNHELTGPVIVCTVPARDWACQQSVGESLATDGCWRRGKSLSTVRCSLESVQASKGWFFSPTALWLVLVKISSSQNKTERRDAGKRFQGLPADRGT